MSTQKFKKFIPKKSKFYVYVAGPISKGPLKHNMSQAVRAFNMFVYAGMVPFVPHATTLLNMKYVNPSIDVAPTNDYHFWLDYDFSYLRDVCHTLLRLPGESWGTERELEYMAYLNKPTFDTIEEIFDYAESIGYDVNRKAAERFAKDFDYDLGQLT